MLVRSLQSCFIDAGFKPYALKEPRAFYTCAHLYSTALQCNML